MATILVTGGAGYIGSHIVAVLAAAGHRCLSVDNYSNSSPRALERAAELAAGRIEAFEADIRDDSALARILAACPVDSVIHMAGLKAVGESVRSPERYHDNNVRGTAVLLRCLAATPVRRLVFSSSATVYGVPGRVPIDESAPLAPTSPYGENKAAIERMLGAVARDDPRWRIASLRYFNPVGAHPSGRIGEDPRGVPDNLMPFICRVAAGRMERLHIFGADYPTHDGTGVRDYIHVMDLAEAHVAALDGLDRVAGGTLTVNVGTGRGFSVLEMVSAFERVNGVRVPRAVAPRRPGDVASCFADPSRAWRTLGWRARRGIEDMCRDAWRWQASNPDGYG